jgi:glycerophosphoryl diester phosphodiesterase
MARPLLLGHRGARKYAPENTLPALQLAIDHGCDGFEFDVRITSDAKTVICHDPRYYGLEVSRSTYTQLEAKCPEDAHIPTLEQVLKEFAASAFLDIELKVSGTESETLELLRQHPPQKGCVVSSFVPEVIEELARLQASMSLGLICETSQQFSRWRDLPIAAVMLRHNITEAAVVDHLHEAGKQVFVWTVNRAPEMRKFAAMGVDGIISDDTKLLVETLG